MAKRQRLTNNSDETEIAQLLSGDTVFSVPYFQRPYRWKPERVKHLQADLLKLVDGSSDFHFLGAVIMHGRRSNPSDPDVYDLIDGQQRITTLYLNLCALVKVLCESNEHAEAAALFLKYLVIPRDTPLVSNLKLHSCKDDREQLNGVFRDLMADRILAERVRPFTLKPLPGTGGEKGTIKSNFHFLTRFYRQQVEEAGLVRLRAIYTAMLEQVSVVQIDVWDPTNGPKIFDALNSRQEPMTIGDLVRNEVFSRVANEHPDKIEQLDLQHWQPFYKKFQQGDKNLFDAYFFPYGLTQNPNLRKSDVYAYLRSTWVEESDPAKIIGRLAKYQNSFLDLACGTNYQNHAKALHRIFKNFWEMGAPTATYPFLMQLSEAARTGEIQESDATETLESIESFLVRRAICGHEPTGLHAVFKGLWVECNQKPTHNLVTTRIRDHKTVVWPSASDVEVAIAERAIYGTSIAEYLIIEYDRSLKGDNPNIRPWIEHVLPENPEKSWFDLFSKAQHLEMKDLFANLIPLSSAMNSSLGNKPYFAKKIRYLDDAAFKSARKFAETYSNWTPDTMRTRGSEIAKWAGKRWPH